MNPLSTALVNIRRSPYQALASVLLIFVTFLMAYSFTYLLFGANTVLRYFETRPQIIGFFQLDATTEDLAAAENSLKLKPYITETKVVSKEEALALYKAENQDDPLLLELVTADILPPSIEVSGNTIQDLAVIKSDLEDIATIDEVVYQEDIIQLVTEWTSTLRISGLIIVSMLALISFLTITVIIMMKATSKKTSVKIMRLLGATNWFVKAPFVVEGMLYGLMGSLLGWLVTYGLLLYLSPNISDFVGDIPVLPIPAILHLTLATSGTFLGSILGGLAASSAAGSFAKR
ncbi:MAG: hypothetical protein H6774_01525 [Pseudomonadales bacterium]|nr:permease-like cell division protein FtsX [Candidatus Woesebacteria bacterium]MCB9801748.1 hypothetical protein [Pseudomonadales bacterium]